MPTAANGPSTVVANGHKRPHDGDAAQYSEQIHPSRKRRLDYSEADAQFARIYDELADDIQAVRLTAAGKLVRALSTTSDAQIPRLQSAIARLIKGLCSGRKAARLGFSIALAEVLRLAFGLGVAEFTLAGVTGQVAKLTTVEGNVSGQEKRDYLIGRRFAFQAILQSDVGVNAALPQHEWQAFIGAFVEQMAEKPWLRRDCGAMLYEFLASRSGTQLSSEQMQTIIDWVSAKALWKTPEGVALWLLFSTRTGLRLPDGVWNKKGPLAKSERHVLSKVLQEVPVEDGDSTTTSSGSRQAAPSFAWSVIMRTMHYSDKLAAEHRELPITEDFATFWTACVDQTLFNESASSERKALGLQVLSLAISTAPPVAVGCVFSPNVLRCIVAQRADPQRYLFEAAKAPLNQLISRGKQDSAVAGNAASSLIRAGAINFDQATKTKTMDILLMQADHSKLEDAMDDLKTMILKPVLKSEDQGSADNARRMTADFVLTVVRSRKPAELFLGSFGTDYEPTPPRWLSAALNILVEMGYWKLDKSLASPAISDATRQVCRQRLSSIIGHVMKLPLAQASRTLRLTVEHLRSVGEKSYGYPAAGKEVKALVRKTDKRMQDTSMLSMPESGKSEDVSRAFVLLYAMAVLQVYNQDTDAGPALQDLHDCAGQWEEDTQSVSTLVELLLSFVSKQSTLYRKLAEQVFTTFAASLTPEGLQSMLAVLAQRENLSGQQELFRNEEDEAEEGSEEEEEGSIIDVDDMSDVELVNGEAVKANASDGSQEEAEEDDEGPEEDSESEATNDDEDLDAIAAFDQKLAAALGSAAMADDDDGSDMDDEQMMAVEPALQNVFKELKKKSGQKQDNRDAKDTIVSFKNRVLDLLSIYVKTQYSNVLALDIIVPLVVLIRETTGKPTAEKAFAALKQYFEACNKHKTLPVMPHEDAGFALLSLMHVEMTKGGSKLHSNACSRSSLFLSKVLVAMNPACYGRIVGMYAQLQEQWWKDPNSKVQSSVFTEWTSWSVAMRRQA
ncbi:DNA-directed DNA polymerase [Oleoguttula sp. CCFEE 5521]